MKQILTIIICLLGLANTTVWAQLSITHQSIENGATHIGTSDTLWVVSNLGINQAEPIVTSTGNPIEIQRRNAYEAMNLVKEELAKLDGEKPMLTSLNGLSVSPDGTAPVWTFTFFQPENRTKLQFSVSGDGEVRSVQMRDSSVYRPIPIDSGWVNSDVLFENLEEFKNGQSQEMPIMHLHLIQEVKRFPMDTILTWNLRIIDRANQKRPRLIRFDALTGNVYQEPVFAAFDGIENSENLAKNWDSEAVLFKINSVPQIGVTMEGNAPVWQHWYQSPQKTNMLFIVSVSGNQSSSREIMLDSARTFPVFPALGTLENLLNSTQIMTLSELNGGSEQRNNSDFLPVDMNLDNVYVQADSTLPVWMVHYPRMVEGRMRHTVIQLNAITGELFECPVRTSERNPVWLAMETAKTWSRDARIRFASADSVDEKGLVDLWRFGFVSREKQLGLMIEVQSGTTIIAQYEISTEEIRLLGKQDLPDWQESTDAIAKAEAVVGRKYRENSRVKNVKALLSVPDEEAVAKSATLTSTELATWTITYELTDNISQVVFVQGETITTSVESLTHELPTQTRLDQNYPNPFNPTTTIGFSIQQRAEVELAVYSILGQRVATLVQQQLTAGSYAVPFNASQLASGTYLYQLKVNDQPIQVRKLTLIK